MQAWNSVMVCEFDLLLDFARLSALLLNGLVAALTEVFDRGKKREITGLSLHMAICRPLFPILKVHLNLIFGKKQLNFPHLSG